MTLGDHPKALTTALDAIGYADFEAERARAAAQGRLVGIGFACYVEYTAINSRAFAARGMRGDPRFQLRARRPAARRHGACMDDAARDRPGHGDHVRPARGRCIRDPYAAVGPQGRHRGRKPRGHRRVCQPQRNGGRRRDHLGVRRAAPAVLADAAEFLEAAVDDLVMTDDGVQIAGVPHPPVPLAELAARAPPERYQVSDSFDPPAASYPYGTHACVAEIDPGTGRVHLLRYVVVDDCGTVLNPRIVEGQVHGAVTQGIAGALYEEIQYSDIGQPLTGSLMDYHVPIATEVPAFILIHLKTRSPHAPHGVKGAGEGGTIAPGAAVANAISDALGGECNALPVKPANLLELMRHSQPRRVSAVSS